MSWRSVAPGKLNALSHPNDNLQVGHFVVCSVRRGNDFRFCEILEVDLGQVLHDNLRVVC